MQSSVLLKYFMLKQREKFYITLRLNSSAVTSFSVQQWWSYEPPPPPSFLDSTVSFTVFLEMTGEIGNVLECDIM